MKHQILTPKECRECTRGFHREDGYCNICDGGLAVCKVCGLAEIELVEQPECKGADNATCSANNEGDASEDYRG